MPMGLIFGARLLGIHDHTVMTSVHAAADHVLKASPMPTTSETVELDELCTLRRAANQRVSVVTALDRATHTFVGWTVVEELFLALYCGLAARDQALRLVL